MGINNAFISDQQNYMVSEMLEDSFDIVKSVYRKLDTLEDFQNNVNLEKIEDNLDTLKTVTSNIDTLQSINDGMDDIKRAPQLVQQVEDSLLTAEQQGNAHIAEAEQTIAEAQKVADTYATAVDTVVDNMDSINNVSNNIGHVKTVSNNIEDITTVSEYLTKDADTEVEFPPDFGVIGTDDDILFDGDTALEVVARNIPVLTAIFKNIEKILALADDGKVQSLVELANRIGAYIEEVRSIFNKVKKVSKELDTKIADFEETYDEASKKIEDFLTNVQQLETRLKKELQEYLDKAEASATTAEQYARACNNVLIKVREEYKLLSNALDKKAGELTGCLKKLGDKITLAITNAEDAAVDRIQSAATDAVNSAAQNAADKFDQKIEKKLQEAYAKITEELNKKLNEVQKKIDAALAELTDKVNQAVAEAQETIKNELALSLEVIKKEAQEIHNKIDTKYNEILASLEQFKKDLFDEVNGRLNNVYRLKGSVHTFDDLAQYESTAVAGDTYIVSEEDGLEYAWTGSKWEALGRNSIITDYGIIGD